MVFLKLRSPSVEQVRSASSDQDRMTQHRRRFGRKTFLLAMLLSICSCAQHLTSAEQPRAGLAVTPIAPRSIDDELRRSRIYAGENSRELAKKVHQEKLKGWDHVFRLLVEKGVDPRVLVQLFTDPRMPAREVTTFSLETRESPSLYRKQNTAAVRTIGLRFYRRHSTYFKQAEERFGVSRSIILSLLLIETKCGQVTGSNRALPRLVRLVGISSPDTVEQTYRLKYKNSSQVTRAQVEARGQWFAEEFLPHVIGALILAEKKKIDPFEIYGSSAGAIGMPQFLPGNIIRYGIDADGDGEVNLFEGPDAILSVANYLAHFGWKRTGMTRKEKQAVIKTYNQSEPYIDTALSLADSLETELRAK